MIIPDGNLPAALLMERIIRDNTDWLPERAAAGRLWQEGEPVHPLQSIQELNLDSTNQAVNNTKEAYTSSPTTNQDDLFSSSFSLTPVRESAQRVLPEGNRALDQLYPMAEAIMQDFDSIVRNIGSRLGLRTMMRQSLKGRARALQKTIGDNKGDAGKLLDVFGGTLILPDSADFTQVISAVKQSGMTIARIKNGYQANDPYGYADIKLNVQMPNGFIGEIILIEEHMMRIKNGPGHKIYEIGRNLQDELERNENNPTYSEKQRQLVTNYISTLQQLSQAYYSNQEQNIIKNAEQEAREAYSKLTDWAVSNASSKEESGIVPLAGLGEEMYSDSSNLAEPSLATSTWYVFPDLSLAQEASPSPLVQNLTSSTSDALNNISTDNVTPSLTHVKSALQQASSNPDITGSSMDTAHHGSTNFSLAEMRSIKDTAVANGTFMKAPNGKRTNLTESQWLSVRTGAFKNWFGDWEKVARLSFDSNTVSIAQAEKHLRSLKGREISNEETGISVSINSNQRRELLNASKARRSHENGFAYHGHYAVVSSYR